MQDARRSDVQSKCCFLRRAASCSGILTSEKERTKEATADGGVPAAAGWAAAEAGWEAAARAATEASEGWAGAAAAAAAERYKIRSEKKSNGKKSINKINK